MRKFLKKIKSATFTGIINGLRAVAGFVIHAIIIHEYYARKQRAY